MKTLIISDIHANLNALEAVLSHAGQFDNVWCLGDLVGYGPQPNECIERVQSLPNFECVVGNHDAAVVGMIQLTAFNSEARISAEWTQGILTKENEHYLQNLPKVIIKDNVTLVHGSPFDPIWEYVTDTYTARMNFEAMETPLCFIGHSHLPIHFRLEENGQHVFYEIPKNGEPIEIVNTAKYILNPGSVGQPRDHDPRASYAIYDSVKKHWQNYRVDYDIKSVQEKILKLELPRRHAARLAVGY
jgi:diadenosine tetraphosphatase ApaH/serine/threonine PP2A family protein phosphatase